MNNVLQIVWLIPLLPLIGFIINGGFRNYLSKGLSGFVGSAVVFISFALSIWVFTQVKSGNVHTAHYFNLFSNDLLKVGFDLKIDQLSALFLLIITGVGFLIHVYSTSYMHHESNADFAKYFSFLNLFVFSMLLLVMGANYVIMFIGWEGVGLCSYLLIGYWFKNYEYTNAAKKAFIMNRIGDLGFLLALFWLALKVGSLQFDQVFSAESLKLLSTQDITGITLLLFVGATGKSAQIPLYTWLPDAMAGPTPVSALIHAATMVTAGIYMIARSNVLYSMAPLTQNVMMVIGTATAILAATIALRQNDIKKILAYSTVSQLGFMFIALGVGAYTGAVFHVMTHAFFKALLFLGAGSVIHAMGGAQDIRQMGGLKKYMSGTHITFLAGCLAIAGFPGFSGFFSKDEILAGAFAKSPVLWGVAVVGAMLTAFYMFRLYILTFLGRFRGTNEQQGHLHESPAAMTVPLWILAILSVVAGFVGIPAFITAGAHKLGDFLSPVFAQSATHAHEVSHSTEWMIMAISVVAVLAAIGFAFARFKGFTLEKDNTNAKGLLENKWFVDEFYNKVIVHPLQSLSLFSDKIIERKGIDGIVNGVGKLVNYGSRQMRWVQSGQVGAYVLLMVLGMVALFLIELFL